MLDRRGHEGPGSLTGIILAGLAMSVGWGFRGDYGHEAGAMVPGALVGLAVCLACGREDWWRRAGVMGLAGAIGWAFGGQMSYGRIVGYTAAASPLDVFYGYACLFVIGGLWAGIGAAILTMSVTESRFYLEQFVRPLVILWIVWLVMSLTGLTDALVERWYLHDTDWVGASSALVVAALCAAVVRRDRGACALIAVLASGWWGGYLLLTGLFDLHMTPPRSDNWAGCTGLFVALILYLRRRQNRAAATVAAWGFLIGGLGFVLGDFANMLGRAQWGPIGRYEALQGLDYWKWMEQSFGLIMGLGVGALLLGRLRRMLSPAPEDAAHTRLGIVSVLFLLVVMMWSNLFKNVRNWAAGDHIPPDVLGVDSTRWFLAIGVLLSAVAVGAIVRHRRGALALAPPGALGRGQLLFLLVLWIAVVGALTQAMPNMAHKGVFLVHVSFWITAGLCSLIVVILPGSQRCAPEQHLVPSDATWRPGRNLWILCALCILIICAAACLTVRSHEGPLPGSQTRFSTGAAPTGP